MPRRARHGGERCVATAVKDTCRDGLDYACRTSPASWRRDPPGVAGDERRVAAAAREQLVVRAELDDAAAVEHDDLVGVADGREPVRDRDRRPPLRQPLERGLDEPARSACRARTSPRRGRGSAGCGGSSARSRCAASRRPRSGSRARRRPCRSRPAASRSARGSAPRAPPPRSPRRSRSGFAKRRFSRTLAWKRYVSCETTPTAAVSDSNVSSRTSTPSIATRPRSRRRAARRGSRRSSCPSRSRRRAPSSSPAAPRRTRPAASRPRRRSGTRRPRT